MKIKLLMVIGGAIVTIFTALTIEFAKCGLKKIGWLCKKEKV